MPRHRRLHPLTRALLVVAALVNLIAALVHPSPLRILAAAGLAAAAGAALALTGSEDRP
ncbi:hypothetical protein [Mangrovihabitans endophyticus]|uniref:hypothetical protein n=1 Tax=Mangrovihabitans endophyticus TaxID=1751298 RepID=UPI00166DEAC6|nr:hypothetical protein [Mangrovihabitans endophyticus]